MISMSENIKYESEKQLAEAYVGGILRGGYLIDGRFCFHAGTAYIETEDFRELRILEQGKITFQPETFEKKLGNVIEKKAAMC
jgi:hypothetical protein